MIKKMNIRKIYNNRIMSCKIITAYNKFTGTNKNSYYIVNNQQPIQFDINDENDVKKIVYLFTALIKETRYIINVILNIRNADVNSIYKLFQELKQILPHIIFDIIIYNYIGETFWISNKTQIKELILINCYELKTFTEHVKADYVKLINLNRINIKNTSLDTNHLEIENSFGALHVKSFEYPNITINLDLNNFCNSFTNAFVTSCFGGSSNLIIKINKNHLDDDYNNTFLSRKSLKIDNQLFISGNQKKLKKITFEFNTNIANNELMAESIEYLVNNLLQLRNYVSMYPNNFVVQLFIVCPNDNVYENIKYINSLNEYFNRGMFI